MIPTPIVTSSSNGTQHAEPSGALGQESRVAGRRNPNPRNRHVSVPRFSFVCNSAVWDRVACWHHGGHRTRKGSPAHRREQASGDDVRRRKRARPRARSGLQANRTDRTLRSWQRRATAPRKPVPYFPSLSSGRIAGSTASLPSEASPTLRSCPSAAARTASRGFRFSRLLGPVAVYGGMIPGRP